MAVLTRQLAFTPVTAANRNAHMDETERIAAGTFGDATRNYRPLCTVRRTTNQSIANNTDTLTIWQAADDPLGLWDPGTPTRITAVDGLLLVVSQVRYAGSATGTTRINKVTTTNDAFASVISEVNGAARSLGTSIHTARVRRFTSSEAIYQWVAQDSGGALNLATDVGGNTLSVVWLGP